MLKDYHLATVPAYRKPLVIALIQASDMFTDGCDTVENLDALARDLLDLIQECDMLTQHALPVPHD